MSIDQDLLKNALIKHRSFFDSTPVPLIALDNASSAVTLNTQAKQLFNYPDEHSLKIDDLLSKEAIERLKTTPFGRSFSAQGIKNGSQSFYAECTSLPLRESNLQLTLIAITDQSQSQLIENSLSKENQQLKKINEELSQFASLASHDLQSPLRRTNSFLKLISTNYGTLFDHEGKDWIARCTNNLEKMQKSITDLLYYSRLNEISGEFAHCDLNEILEALEESLKHTLNVKPFLNLETKLPVIVGDSTLLSMLFRKLLENSLEHSENREVIISVTVAEKPDHWTLVLNDNGLGISSEDRLALNSKLEDLHNKGSYPSSGLSLPICQRIAAIHGGVIELLAPPQELGASVAVTLSKLEL